MPQAVAIVQARMGSSRFPGKMLTNLRGRPLIDYSLSRLSTQLAPEGPISMVVVATSHEATDDPLVDHIRMAWPKIHIARGPESDVLARFLMILEKYPTDTFLRISGDCPLLNTQNIPLMIEAHKRTDADITNYRPGFEYIDKGIEVVSAQALRTSADDPDSGPADREHVTSIMYRHPDRYRINYVDSEDYLRRGDIRLTVDEPEDLEFLEKLLKKANGDISHIRLMDIVKIFDHNPELAVINAGAGRKSTRHESVRLGFRCDGDSQIGLGHIVGSLRLAKVLSTEMGIGIEFIICEEPSAVRMIKEAGYSCEVLKKNISPEQDINRTVQKMDESDLSGVVINFNKDYLDRYARLFHLIKKTGKKLIFTDNPVPSSYRTGDLLINALPHPEYEGYDPSGHVSCYDGLDYFIADENFLPFLGLKRKFRGEIGRVLVTMGGGDAQNLTTLVLKGLDASGFGGSVDVVLGSANPHEQTISRLLDTLSIDATVSRNVDDMPKRIWEADIGFSSLGLTTYEMALLGLPAIILAGTEFNVQVAEIYSRMNTGCIDLGFYKKVSSRKIVDAVKKTGPRKIRENLSSLSGMVVDGRGKERILRIFYDLFNMHSVREL